MLTKLKRFERIEKKTFIFSTYSGVLITFRQLFQCYLEHKQNYFFRKFIQFQCYRNEGTTPFRPSMPCLVRYKSIVRNDFFGDLPGVVGVHGEPWREFRSRVQKPVLQLTTVRRYVRPLEEVTDYFIERCQDMLDENQELPDDFDNEIHKWSLECKLQF